LSGSKPVYEQTGRFKGLTAFWMEDRRTVGVAPRQSSTKTRRRRLYPLASLYKLETCTKHAQLNEWLLRPER
jgi:hypothetical protein